MGEEMVIGNVLEYALQCYNFQNCNIENINSGSNRVYKIHKGGLNFYLRISTREYSCISAEIDWMLFLKDIIKAPVLLKSDNGKLIETFYDNEKSYVICVFYELTGVFWDKNNPSLWNETVFFNWGNAMGKMHRVTKKYQPPVSLIKRPLFENNLIPLEPYKNIPSVYEKLASILNDISKLPHDVDSYGLIHSDMHQQNFLINRSHISILDFEDCQYGYFSLDIGIALYHAIWWGLPEDDLAKNDFALKIIKNFMLGYTAENQLSDFWLKKIKMFMLYRQIDALRWHLNYYKPKSMNEVVYNDLFDICYNFEKNIKYIENDIFYENCKIVKSDFT